MSAVSDIASVGLAALVVALLIWQLIRVRERLDHASDSDDSGSGSDGGGGGGNMRRKGPPRGSGGGGDPVWWPAFEREFAEYVARARVLDAR